MITMQWTVNFNFLIAAGIIPAILLVVASHAECNRIAFITLLIINGGFSGGYHAGMRVNILGKSMEEIKANFVFRAPLDYIWIGFLLDLTQNYAGALLAYTNGIGSNGSFIFPGIIGMIITDVSIFQYLKNLRNPLELKIISYIFSQRLNSGELFSTFCWPLPWSEWPFFQFGLLEKNNHGIIQWQMIH